MIPKGATKNFMSEDRHHHDQQIETKWNKSYKNLNWKTKAEETRTLQKQLRVQVLRLATPASPLPSVVLLGICKVTVMLLQLVEESYYYYNSGTIFIIIFGIYQTNYKGDWIII